MGENEQNQVCGRKVTAYYGHDQSCPSSAEDKYSQSHLLYVTDVDARHVLSSSER